MSDTVVKAENLSKVYKLYKDPIDRLKEALNPFGKKYHHDFYALKDISFEVKKGETIGIIGKNGSGKSTLLKILTGVLTQTSGTCHVRGKISSLLELGAGFNPELSGIENVYFNGSILGYSKEEMDSKLAAILEFADIGEFVYQPVKTYSSGMSVRLAFAVAISVDPDVLIVDEALAVGDMFFQAKCYRKFKEFQSKGNTIVFVTHSLDTVKTYCNKVIFLDSGTVKEIGSPKEVVNTYLMSSKKLLQSKKIKIEPLRDVINAYSKITEEDLCVINKSFWYNKDEDSSGSGGVVFTKVGFFDENGIQTQSFEVGKVMSMVLEFESKNDIDCVSFGYGFRNIKGQDLFVFNGEEAYDNFSIMDVKKGSVYRISVKQNIALIPGDYTISLSLISEKGDGIEHLQMRYDVLALKIVGDGRFYAGVFTNSVDISYEQI